MTTPSTTMLPSMTPCKIALLNMRQNREAWEKAKADYYESARLNAQRWFQLASAQGTWAFQRFQSEYDPGETLSGFVLCADVGGEPIPLRFRADEIPAVDRDEWYNSEWNLLLQETLVGLGDGTPDEQALEYLSHTDYFRAYLGAVEDPGSPGQPEDLGYFLAIQVELPTLKRIQEARRFDSVGRKKPIEGYIQSVIGERIQTQIQEAVKIIQILDPTARIALPGSPLSMFSPSGILQQQYREWAQGALEEAKQLVAQLTTDLKGMGHQEGK